MADDSGQREGAATGGLDVEQLLQIGVRTARAGEKQRARALFRALTHAQPTDVRPWLWLAGVAADDTERREALEQALAIDPQNQLALQGLKRLQQQAPPHAAPPTTTPPEAEPPVVPPDAEDYADYADEQPAPARRGFWWLLLPVVALLLVFGLLAFVLWPQVVATPAPASPTLPGLAVEQTTAPQLPPALTTAPVTTAVPVFSPTPAATDAGAAPGVSPSAAEVTATPNPGQARTPFPLGTPLEFNDWRGVLLRPDYALALEGALGERQPDGRFVLALLAVSNSAGEPRVIPPDLFVLVDDQGRSYRSVPGASSSYLALYGRGARGDLALEDPIPPGGGLYSVPLIFDVPPDASGLMLTMGRNVEFGWLLPDQVNPRGSPVAPTVEVGP